MPIEYTYQDAAIATHVVFQSERIYVYTVHDGFISPAAHAGKLSRLYTKSFVELAHLLYLLNFLIFHNLSMDVFITKQLCSL